MPAVVARMPLTMSTVCTAWARISETKPACREGGAEQREAVRRLRRGGATGQRRDDRAVAPTVRAGHHDAASAVRIARTAPAITAHQGRANGS